MRRLILVGLVFLCLVGPASASEMWPWPPPAFPDAQVSINWDNPGDTVNESFSPKVDCMYYDPPLISRKSIGLTPEGWWGAWVKGPHKRYSGPVLWSPKQTAPDTVRFMRYTGLFGGGNLVISREVQSFGPSLLFQIRPKFWDYGMYTVKMAITDDNNKFLDFSPQKREVQGGHRHLVTLGRALVSDWYAVKHPLILALEGVDLATDAIAIYGIVKAAATRVGIELAKVAAAFAVKLAARATKKALVQVYLRTEECFYWRVLNVWCNGSAENYSPVAFYPTLYRQRQLLDATITYPGGTVEYIQGQLRSEGWTKEVSFLGTYLAWDGISLPKFFSADGVLRFFANAVADDPTYWRSREDW